MVKKISVSGYEEFRKTVQDLSSETTPAQVNIYFTGQKDDKGISWCPDCNVAEPFVMDAQEEHADNDSVFVVVDVGARSFWKDMQNPFRKDSDIQLSVIPTLLRWKSVARLDGEQCAKEDLLEMFFTEED